MKNLKFAAAVALAASMCAVGSVPSGAAGWYCRHTTGGEVPDMPGEFVFLRDIGSLWLDEDAAARGDKVIYLTFDAGYENGNVEKILDTLAEKDAPGAFFVLSHLVEANGDLVRRMRDEGHLVCNHTAHHKNLTKLSDAEVAAELSALETTCRDTLGFEPAKFYRPPEGEIDERSAKCAADLGYTAVMWSFAYADWDNERQPDEAAALQKLEDGAHPGEILLLHPTSATNAAILGRFIDDMRAHGWRFGSLDGIGAADRGGSNDASNGVSNGGAAQ